VIISKPKRQGHQQRLGIFNNPSARHRQAFDCLRFPLLSPDARALNFPSRTFFPPTELSLLTTHHLPARNEYIFVIHSTVDHLSGTQQRHQQEKKRKAKTLENIRPSCRRCATQFRGATTRSAPNRSNVRNGVFWRSTRLVHSYSSSTTLITNEFDSRSEKKDFIANQTPSKIGLLPPSKRPQ